MSETTHHNEPDPDSSLAREIGRRLEEKTRDEQPLAPDGQDAFVAGLLAYRDTVLEGNSASEEFSQRLWKKIDPSQSRVPAVTLTPIRMHGRRWAMAAAASVALLIGLYALLGGNEEVVLATTESGIETLALGDGSTVTLRQHSSLVLVNAENHRYRLDGEALFEVAHNPDREFVVETSLGSVAVLGTHFGVSTWADETQVYLIRGRVRVDRASSTESLTLEPGQAAVIDRNMITKSLSDSAGSTYTDWLMNELSFDQSPSYRIAAELGHHFAVTLVLPAQLAHETLSGRILLTSLGQSLEDLSTVLDGHFEPNGTASYILVPN